jgi:hypothetical protein
MGWTVLVQRGEDPETGEVQAEVAEKFSFREEAETYAEQERAANPGAQLLVTEDLP